MSSQVSISDRTSIGRRISRRVWLRTWIVYAVGLLPGIVGIEVATTMAIGPIFAVAATSLVVTVFAAAIADAMVCLALLNIGRDVNHDLASITRTVMRRMGSILALYWATVGLPILLVVALVALVIRVAVGLALGIPLIAVVLLMFIARFELGMFFVLDGSKSITAARRSWNLSRLSTEVFVTHFRTLYPWPHLSAPVRRMSLILLAAAVGEVAGFAIHGARGAAIGVGLGVWVVSSYAFGFLRATHAIYYLEVTGGKL